MRPATVHIIQIISKAMVLALLPTILTGCQLEDDRDMCCVPANLMCYSYRPTGTEEFHGHISSLRHYLYDDGGYFIREVDPGVNLTRQYLELPSGNYTMLTIGNLADTHTIMHADDYHIGGLTLAPSTHAGATLGNASELFWGLRHFDVAPSGVITDTGPDRCWADYIYPTTEMNNIHCHLRVRVEWNNLPEKRGIYEMELSGVPSAYHLDPGSAMRVGGFTIPPHIDTGVHRLPVLLDGYELDGRFVTLRYTDNVIPSLRLFFDQVQIGPTIDLKKAFSEWGWHPSRVHVQDYAIKVKLYDSGRAEVSPYIEGSVNDWINGGYFS